MLFRRYKWESVYHCLMRPAARDEDFVANWYQQLKNKRAQAFAAAKDRQIESVSVCSLCNCDVL